jgi:hypothetical protein
MNLLIHEPITPYGRIQNPNDDLARAEDVREAQNLWAAFNSALHRLGPPPEVVDGWDLIRPWLNRRAREFGESGRTIL